MARPTVKGKRMSMGIDADLVGWLELMGRGRSTGQAGYLMELARRDRESRTAGDPDLERRYRMYLEACGYGAELESLNGTEA